MKYKLGLDQGGTKTIAALADRSGRILAAGYAGGSCHSTQGMAHSMERVKEAVTDALRRAEAEACDIESVHAGMTGADFPYEYALLREALKGATGVADVTVVNDCIIAYRGGTSSPAGAVLCIGTGTNVAILRPGQSPFIYGYHVRDDDSGGESLGSLALRAALDSDVGLGPQTQLKPRILAHYGLADADTLMEHWIQGKLGSKKHLAPLVFEAAGAGDDEAAQLVRAFGRRNARYVEAGLANFGIQASEAVVILSGSLFKARPAILTEAVTDSLTAAYPGLRIAEAAYEPVVGAVLMALDRDLGQPFPMYDQTLKTSVAELGLFRTAE
ncbi:N-acetylglucosamine kinase [Cohnella sp. GCM10012308]|uniref:N-acetylglucosamine kinase n=1 Tax=Cohnella sp. GCM10012308 TaxID=3317329 RepID=UPI003621FCAC